MKKKTPSRKKKRIGEGVGRAPEGVHAGGERGEVRGIMEGTRTSTWPSRLSRKKSTKPIQSRSRYVKKKNKEHLLSLSLWADASRDEGDDLSLT